MPEQKVSTKDKLLDISKELMMSKGYNATTIEEICKIASVTKGAFFYYFKTKEDLGVSVLHYYWQLRQQQFMRSDWMEADHPLDQISRFLDAVADVFMHDPHGVSCLAGVMTQELSTINPMFQKLLADLFREWAEQVKPILQEAKTLADSDADVDLLADHILVVIEGALIPALARQDASLIAAQLRMLDQHIRLTFQK